MLQVLGLGTHDEEVYLTVVARSGRAVGLPTPAVERLVTAGLLVPDRQHPGRYLTADLLALLERTLGGHAERPPAPADGRCGPTTQISRPHPADAAHRHPGRAEPPRPFPPGTNPPTAHPAPGHLPTGHVPTGQHPPTQPQPGSAASTGSLHAPQATSGPSAANRPLGTRPPGAPGRAPAPTGRDATAPSPRPTPAERDLVALLADGLTDEVIARRLGVSYRTVQRRVHSLLQRLEARTRFQAGVAAARHAWI